MKEWAGYPMVEYADDFEKEENKNRTYPFTLGIKDRMSFIGTYRFVRDKFHSALLEVDRVAKVGMPAPNVDVIDLLLNKSANLLDYQDGNKPLVLNFGSCTWPPFLAAMDGLAKLCSEFKDRVTFLTVYINEAHSIESGDYSTYIPKVKDHKTIQERIKAAQILQQLSSKELNELCPIVLDNMEDEANIKYAAEPDRLYVVQNGKVVFDGGAGPFGYDLKTLAEWLNRNS